MLLLLEVRHTFIQLKLHLSFNILTLHTNIKIFKMGSKNYLNACENLQMSGEILHFIFRT
ncbi:hypothetical protein E2C01_075386 [Portunus trituberculatus]|uniref:Uncharacterized protein n=1 Tax=Portunus trituberculatus TaxID=210409 RepID=A0A5B7IEV0_PORTR|nr:hypothetical protein [Portunus trituberculatus]